MYEFSFLYYVSYTHEDKISLYIANIQLLTFLNFWTNKHELDASYGDNQKLGKLSGLNSGKLLHNHYLQKYLECL